MEEDAVFLNVETTQKHLHVGKRGHEFLCNLSDRASAHGWNAAVNRDRAFWRKECRHAGCILAAPRRSVTPREISQICRFKTHGQLSVGWACGRSVGGAFR